MASPALLPVADLPEPGDLVWCKFPKRHLPDERRVARPVLVRANAVHRHDAGYEFGSLTVTYGTDARGHGDRRCDFFLDWPECRNVGLHKATVFILDRMNTKHLLWSEEYFVPQSYVRNRGLLIGRLDPRQIAHLTRQAAEPRPQP